jgi:hypothetical protein
MSENDGMIDNEALVGLVRSTVERLTGGQVKSVDLHATAYDGQKEARVEVVMPIRLDFVSLNLAIPSGGDK